MIENTYPEKSERVLSNGEYPFPLEYFSDKDGFGWLCDEGTDPLKDFKAQGCWRCDEMAYPRAAA